LTLTGIGEETGFAPDSQKNRAGSILISKIFFKNLSRKEIDKPTKLCPGSFGPSRFKHDLAYSHNDPVDDPDGNYAILRRDGAQIHLILDEPPQMHPWSTARSTH
jgi:hypothetical protein